MMARVQYFMKANSFSKQYFAGSSLYTIWRYFQQVSAEESLKISRKYPQIVSSEARAKDYLKNKWTLRQYDEILSKFYLSFNKTALKTLYNSLNIFL